jgi:hypothetical protein
VPKDIKDIGESRRRWLLLEALKELKAGDSIFVHGDHFAIQDRRAQFQLRKRLRNRRELLLERQTVSGPEVRLTSRVEHCDPPISVQLDFENPIRRVEWLLRDFSHHGLDEGWQGFLGHL